MHEYLTRKLPLGDPLQFHSYAAIWAVKSSLGIAQTKVGFVQKRSGRYPGVIGCCITVTCFLMDICPSEKKKKNCIKASFGFGSNKRSTRDAANSSPQSFPLPHPYKTTLMVWNQGGFRKLFHAGTSAWICGTNLLTCNIPNISGLITWWTSGDTNPYGGCSPFISVDGDERSNTPL